MKKLILWLLAIATISFCSGCAARAQPAEAKDLEDSIAEIFHGAMNEAIAAIDWADLQETTSQAIAETMADLDYNDYDLTKKQKIEIWSADRKHLLRTITDNHQIINYIKHEHMDKWQYFSTIPKDAEVLLHVVYWQESRHSKGKFVSSVTDTLYHSGGKYFLQTDISDQSIPFHHLTTAVEVPEKTALFLIGVAVGDDILPFRE